MRVEFSANETWCFREERPMEAIGGTAVASVFPPPISTVVGAGRFVIGNVFEVDWHQFSRPDAPPMWGELLGNSEQCGRFRFGAPILSYCPEGTEGEATAWQSLFPIPAFLLRKKHRLFSMRPGEPVLCDLGRVKLPEIVPQSGDDSQSIAGAKSIENAYLTDVGLQALLNGQLPDEMQLIPLNQLIMSEPRLGIGRNQQTASVINGALYQTEHYRFVLPLRIGCQVTISGDDDGDIERQLLSMPAQNIRFGGEGGTALSQFCEGGALPQLADTHFDKASGQQSAVLYLLGPADFRGGWLPTGFKSIVAEDGSTVGWGGELQGVYFEVISACLGKSQRVGGWDMALRQPKPSRSVIPAGSCYFIRSVDMGLLHRVLKEAHIGENTDFGFGQAMLLPLI